MLGYVPHALPSASCPGARLVPTGRSAPALLRKTNPYVLGKHPTSTEAPQAVLTARRLCASSLVKHFPPGLGGLEWPRRPCCWLSLSLWGQDPSCHPAALLLVDGYNLQAPVLCLIPGSTVTVVKEMPHTVDQAHQDDQAGTRWPRPGGRGPMSPGPPGPATPEARPPNNGPGACWITGCAGCTRADFCLPVPAASFLWDLGLQN